MIWGAGILKAAAAVARRAIVRRSVPAPTPERSMLVSPAQLRMAMPHITAANIDRYIIPLNDMLAEYQIDRPLRIAHFLAQVGHESSDLSAGRENLNYSARRLMQIFPKYFKAKDAQSYERQPEKIANSVYAGRLGNGDEASGDGWRYRGGGPMQLTGRDNYAAYAEDCGVDVVADPDLIVEDPVLYIDSAGWFWDGRGLNTFADIDNILAVTKRINGGTIGVSDRRQRLALAKRALGV